MPREINGIDRCAGGRSGRATRAEHPAGPANFCRSSEEPSGRPAAIWENWSGSRDAYSATRKLIPDSTRSFPRGIRSGIRQGWGPGDGEPDPPAHDRSWSRSRPLPGCGPLRPPGPSQPFPGPGYHRTTGQWHLLPLAGAAIHWSPAPQPPASPHMRDCEMQRRTPLGVSRGRLLVPGGPLRRWPFS